MIDLNQKLSENFTFGEMVITTHRGFIIANRLAAVDYIPSLTTLCTTILQPVRDMVALPITVTSGFRCPALNKVVGGAVNSQHQIGEAADIIVPAMPMKDLFDKIRNSELKWGQLIWECGGAWVHISLPTEQLNGQVLSYDGNNYTKI